MGEGRIVMHVDLDAFFASCEERERPELRGKPIVVGADPKGGKGRGVVSTANYEARKFGIRSGMPISKAYALCPDCVFLPVNFKLYEKISARVMGILQRHAVRFEQWGIDEAFLELTGRVRDFEEAAELARKIKEEVFAKEKLTCSVGIGPNKLIAKIASDFKKPNGLTLVKPEEVKEFLAPLPVRKLIFVGPKTEAVLKKMGIRTIGELAKFDATKLVEKFGVLGGELHRHAQGIDESPVGESWVQKSISREHTFEKDTEDEKLISETLKELAEDLLEEVRASHFLFRTITVKVRFAGFETHTHQRTLHFPTNKLDVLLAEGMRLLQPFLKKKKIRLIGLRLSSLIRSAGQKKLSEF